MTDTNLKKLGIPLGIPRADLDSLESAAPCTDSQGAAGILCMAESLEILQQSYSHSQRC